MAGVIFAAALLVVVWQAGVFKGSVDDLASSSDPEKRQEAIRRLGQADSSDATRKLTELASDSDAWTARYAVQTLGKNLTDRNRQALTDIVDNRKMPVPARSEAASILGKFKGVDPQVLTRALATTDENPEVRAGAAKGLARLKMPSTIPQLSKALEDPSPEVRLWAIEAIHRMIVRKFPYDARKSPQEQKEVIDRIRDYLRQCGVLR